MPLARPASQTARGTALAAVCVPGSGAFCDSRLDFVFKSAIGRCEGALENAA